MRSPLFAVSGLILTGLLQANGDFLQNPPPSKPQTVALVNPLLVPWNWDREPVGPEMSIVGLEEDLDGNMWAHSPFEIFQRQSGHWEPVFQIKDFTEVKDMRIYGLLHSSRDDCDFFLIFEDPAAANSYLYASKDGQLERIFPAASMTPGVPWRPQWLSQNDEGSLWFSTLYGNFRLDKDGELRALTTANRIPFFKRHAPEVEVELVPEEVAPTFPWPSEGIGMDVALGTVRDILKGGPADRAGIRIGDQIFAGVDRRSFSMGGLPAGNSVFVEFQSAGSNRIESVELTAVSSPNQTSPHLSGGTIAFGNGSYILQNFNGEMLWMRSTGGGTRWKKIQLPGMGAAGAAFETSNGIRDASGGVILRIGSSLWRLNPEGDGEKLWSDSALLNCRYLSRDLNGWIWLMTERDLYVYDGQRLRHYGSGLLDYYAGLKGRITGLLCSVEGFNYILTEKGLYSHFSDTKRLPLHLQGVRFIGSTDEAAWFESYEGAPRWIPHPDKNIPIEIEGLPFQEAKGLFVLNEKSVAVTAQGGPLWFVSIREDNRWTKPIALPGIEGFQIKDMIKSPEGTLWVCAGRDESRGLVGTRLVTIQNGVAENFLEDPAHSFQKISFLDSDSILLLGEDSYLLNSKDKSLTPVSSVFEFLPHNHLLDLKKDSAGRTAILTPNQVYLQDNGEIRILFGNTSSARTANLKSLQFLGAQLIALGAAEILLFNGTEEWSYELPQTFSYGTFNYTALQKGNGGRFWLNTLENNPSLPEGDHRFGSIELKTETDPLAFSFNQIPPTLSQPVNATLAWRALNSIPSILSANLKYSYRINEGIWSEFSGSNSVRLFDLEPGNKEIQVRIQDGLGIYQPTATQTFRVKPYFFQTATFRFFLILMASAFVLLLMRIYRDKRKLESANTALREQHSDLIRAEEKALDASKAKGDFIANMSHEIRTPMNGVMGMIDLCMETSLDRSQKDFLKTARDSAEALLHIINEILDFSKIESNRLNLENLPFSIRQLISETARPIAYDAAEKGLEVICEVDPQLPDNFLGDPHRLRQIITNLLGNALKFTSKGLILCQITPAGNPREGKVPLRFAVKDTGMGIPADKLETIFETFSQADSSTTRQFGGTGLGLSISSKLVHLMGGKLQVESTVGKGSEFFFSLILPASPVSPADEAVSRKLRNLGVLIVDDIEANRRILRGMTQNWGMIPYECASGPEALQFLENSSNGHSPPSLILLDSKMPEMSGAQVAEKILKAGRKTAKIILLSSGIHPKEEAALQKLGVDQIYRKPVTYFELQKGILLALENDRTPGRPNPSKAPPSSQSTQTPKRVLVAEDNKVNQKVVTSLLKRNGHTAVVVENGQQAVDRVQEDSFDLVLMDLQMPVMDGLEATSRIRQNHPDLPIIALTAHILSEARENYLECGFHGFLSKPFRYADLAAFLEISESPKSTVQLSGD